MKSILKVAALGVLSLSLVSCATITRGTHQTFTVETNPAGAKVVTENGFTCDATPCTFKMPRKPGFKVTISKPGYKTVEVAVTSEMAGSGGAAMAGNVLVGGIIGAAVDGTNGSLNDLKPNPLIVQLEKTE